MTDQRAQYNEYAIGAGHPSEPDVVNRLALIEHNTDGTHKVITLTVADNGNYIGATITQNDVTNNPDAVKIVNAGTGRGLLIDQNGNGRAILIDHDDTGTTPSLDIDRDGNNAGAISGLWVNVANAGGLAYAAIFEAGRVGIGTTTPTSLLDINSTTDLAAQIKTTGTANSARLILASGNATTSARYSYISAESLETTPHHWRFGMYGDKNWQVYDYTNTRADLTIDATTGNIALKHIGIKVAADATAQLKVAYDAAAYMTVTQADGGGVTFASVSDGTASFTFSQHVALSSSFTVANYCQIFGAWASKSDNTVYQADTDGFVLAYADAQTEVLGYTDSSNPPTTLRVGNYGAAVAENWHNGITFPVRKGDYWKVTGATGGDAAAVYWLPKGTGM